MENNGYILLDTKALISAVAKRESLIRSYDEVNERYDRIVSDLLNNWEGRGADAFRKDAQTVKKNIVGIYDMLKVMCDTLQDCCEIFGECDTALGENNRSSSSDR